MANFLISRNNIYIFLICFIINISFSFQEYQTYKIKIPINQNELDNFNITSDKFDKFGEPCKQWVLSIFNPILLAPRIKSDGMPIIDDFTLNIQSLGIKGVQVSLDANVEFLDHKFFLVKENLGRKVEKCYFGLSSGLCKYDEINIEQINLNNLIINKERKIFSFDKCNITDDALISNFYFGDIHEDFKSNNGIIGICGSDSKSFSWGCTFNEMEFNGGIIPLKDSNDTLYNVYFASEIHYPVFPLSFKEEFEKYSNDSCKYKSGSLKLICNNFFKGADYLPLKLKNENMTIIGEIDNEIRFYKIDESENKENIRIAFKEIDYIILPLIVFKNFHIQFNAEDNIIKFFTNNKEILTVKEEEKSSSSSVLKFLIIILIIILILALGILIFFFIKDKNLNIEHSINKFNKFEEEDEFHNMNENRVF